MAQPRGVASVAKKGSHNDKGNGENEFKASCTDVDFPGFADVKTFAPAPPHGVSNSTTPNDCTLLGAIEPRTRDASVPDSTPASSTVAKRLALSLSWDMDEERSASKTHMTDPESNTAKRR
ncbi:hypothetical protein CC2G_009778 [Coprinopsis cinerea AmutBmut pab1-1]|nr:hypothetical protein CC2G_009778 [Coprinopsis cinerea AmutBmut pab1-1]